MVRFVCVVMFESSVNSEGIETQLRYRVSEVGFESSVNSEGIETEQFNHAGVNRFESSVNSEGIETWTDISNTAICLRAV